MSSTKSKQFARKLRQRRTQSRIRGTGERPRLNVFRSSKHIYAQIIDDVTGKTLAMASSATVKSGEGTKTDASTAVGKQLATSAKAAGVTKVVFDRGGYRYHGRVKALADAAREGGLEF